MSQHHTNKYRGKRYPNGGGNGGPSGATATQSKNLGTPSSSTGSSTGITPSPSRGPSSTSRTPRTFKRTSHAGRRTPESDEALAKQMDVVTDEMRKLRRLVLEREEQSSLAVSPRLSPVQRSGTRTADETAKDFTEEFRNFVELLKNLPPGDPYLPRVEIKLPAAMSSSGRAGEQSGPASGTGSMSRDRGTTGASTSRRDDDPESVRHGSMKDVDELERSFFEEAFSREMVSQYRRLLMEQERVDEATDEDLGRQFKKLLMEEEQKVTKLSNEEMGRQYRRLLGEHEPLKMPDEEMRRMGKQTKQPTAAAAFASGSPGPKALPPRSPRPEVSGQAAKNIPSSSAGRRSPSQQKGSPSSDEGKKNLDIPRWKM